jgi:distribution and morphology protein 34
MAGSRGMLAAKQGLVVPMILRLSQFKLNSYVVLVVSKQKGITLVFKTDPLQHVDIHSTFDSIGVIQKFIQREIEGQLRQMFREDLPGIIHRLSQQWVKAKVDAPYLSKAPKPSAPPPTPISPPSPLHSMEGSARRLARHPSAATLRTSQYSASVHSNSPGPWPSTDPSQSDADDDDRFSTLPGLEDYNPTYGLRVASGSHKGSFSGLSRLSSKPRGLAELAEEVDDESPEFDASGWEDSMSSIGSSRSLEPTTPQQYDMRPAVGGGIINRPRVIHSQSSASTSNSTQYRTPGFSSVPSPLSRSLSIQSSLSTSFARPSMGLRMSSVASNPYFPRVPSDLGPRTLYPYTSSPTSEVGTTTSAPHPTLATSAAASRRSMSRTSMLPSPPASDRLPSGDETIRRTAVRRPSLASLATDENGFPDLRQIQEPVSLRIILPPASNDPVSKLSMLSHCNHTLSPFTRSMEHFAVRSGKPRTPAPQPDRVPQKARRKRIYRLGGKKQDATHPSPPPLSEAGSDDMDRYFRLHDDIYSSRGR